MGRKKSEGANALKLEQESKITFLKSLPKIRIKDFGINKLKQEMSVKEFLRQQDKFVYNDPVQRNAEVWDLSKRSLLIHSIIMGIPVPNVFVQMVDGKYNVIDGKQRLTTIRAFVENKFPLDKSTPVVDITDDEGNKYDFPIANHIFNALPEEFQDRIYSHSLVLEVMDMNEEIKNVVFSRLNQTEPLKPIEKIKAHLDEETIEYLSVMSQNEFISRVCLSKNLRNRQGDQEVVLQSLLFIDKNGETGIGSDDYFKWVIDTGVSQKAKSDLAAAIQYLNEVVTYLDIKNHKDVLKKTHIPMLCLVAIKAALLVEPKDFAQWAVSFLIERYKSEQYREFASSKAASKENASARYRLMQKDFNKTFSLSD